MVGHDIRYISTDKNEYKHGGKVIEISKKDNNDYLIQIKASVGKKWAILYSKSLIFYKTKSVTQLKRERTTKWKEDLKINNPEEYQRHLKAQTCKELIRKMDKELYDTKYQYRRQSKKYTS